MGVPKGSLTHRLITKSSKSYSFIFKNENTPTGPSIDISDVFNQLAQMWNNIIGNSVPEEIQFANDFGALSLLQNQFLEKQNKTDDNVTRAYLTSGLLDSLNSKLSHRKKMVRLALFFRLYQMDHWKDIVSKSKKLWRIKPYLDELNQWKSKNPLEIKDTLPKDLSFETAGVCIAHLSSECINQNKEINVNKWLENQPLEIKSTMKISANNLFEKYLEYIHDNAV